MVWHGLCLWSSSFPVSSMHVKDSYLTTWKLNVPRTKAAWQLWRSYIVEKMLFGEKKHSLCSNKNKYTDPLHFWDKWLVFRYKRRSFEFVYCSYKSMNNFKNGAALLFSISLHNLFLDNVWFCNTTPCCDKHFTNEHVLQKISSAKLYWLGFSITGTQRTLKLWNPTYSAVGVLDGKVIVEASYGGMTLLFNLQMVPTDAATSGRSQRRPPERDDALPE